MNEKEELEKALAWAKSIEHAENLSPNERHILALAKEVKSLRLQIKRMNAAAKPSKSART